MGCGLPYEIIDQSFLFRLLPADIYSDDGQVAVGAVKAGDQTGVGPGAAAGTHDPVNLEALVKQLPQNFLRTSDITGGADWI